jgi:hypothetical protein
MSFQHFIPRTLSAVGIRAYAPQASGIYGISNANEWIYIGEAENIQLALLDHLEEIDTSIMQRHPTGFVFEVCDPGERARRQDRLVNEYDPTCNRRVEQ